VGLIPGHFDLGITAGYPIGGSRFNVGFTGGFQRDATGWYRYFGLAFSYGDPVSGHVLYNTQPVRPGFHVAGQATGIGLAKPKSQGGKRSWWNFFGSKIGASFGRQPWKDPWVWPETAVGAGVGRQVGVVGYFVW
jgi:hypothetical protein